MPPRDGRDGASGAARRRRVVPAPRRRGFIAVDVLDEAPAPVGLDGFQELRRMGLFDDDGRNPPQSWWAR
jgi:hypothetical protein